MGDIGNPKKESYQDFIWEQSERFRHVLVVSGNHEYYSNEISEADKLISEICSKKPNVKYLNASTFEYKNVIFVGCTLWSNVTEDKKVMIMNFLNDYRLITTKIDDKIHTMYLFQIPSILLQRFQIFLIN